MAQRSVNCFYNTFASVLMAAGRARTRQIKPKDLTRKIRKLLHDYPVVVQTGRDHAVDFDKILISGFYERDTDSLQTQSIVIVLNFHPDQIQIATKRLDWYKLAFDVAECLGHEQVHHDNRDQKHRAYVSHCQEQHLKDEQEYLGDSDEINAYGFSIAADILIHLQGRYNQRGKAEMYKIYKKVFAKDRQVINQLDQRIQQHLKRLIRH